MTTSLKSVFVTSYLVFLAAATIAAIVQIGSPNFSLGWIGSALTTAPFLVFLSWITITQRRARTSARLPSIMAFAILGAALAAWSWLIGISSPAPAIVALAEKYQVEMPICAAVNEIIGGRASVDEAIANLLARPFRAEKI